MYPKKDCPNAVEHALLLFRHWLFFIWPLVLFGQHCCIHGVDKNTEMVYKSPTYWNRHPITINMIRLKTYMFYLVPTHMFQVKYHTTIIAQRTYLYSKNVFLPSPKEHISIKRIHFYLIPTSMFLLQGCMISSHSNEHTSIRRIYLYTIPIIMSLTYY